MRVKHPLEIPLEWTPLEPKLLRHYRVMIRLFLMRVNLKDRLQALAAKRNRRAG